MPENVPRPIDTVPTAGTRTGHANGAETTEAGLGATDANLEDGEGTLSPRTELGARQSGLPSINVESPQSSQMYQVSL